MSVPCRFYLKGYCRFGDNCRFLHQDPQRVNQNYNTSRTQYTYYAPGYGTQPQNKSQNILEGDLTPSQMGEVIRAEMKEFEKMKWPFSVISIKGYGNVPGFQDTSDEEMHWEYILAEMNNSLADFKIKTDKKMQEIRGKRDMFLRKTPESFEVVNMMCQHRNLSAKYECDKMEDENIAENGSRPSFSFNLSNIPSSNGFSNEQASFSFAKSNFVRPPDFSSVNFGQALPAQNQFMPDAFDRESASGPSTQLVFGQSNQGGFGQSVIADDDALNSIYTPMDRVDEQSMAAFKAATFEIGKIPSIPPPKEFC